MKLTKYGMVMGTCAVAVLCATQLLATQPQPAAATASNHDAKLADRLLSGMRADAQRIQSHAMAMEKLSMDPNAKWAQFDQQWNELKPAQEELQRRIWRLESMRASLSDSQRKTLDDTKQVSQDISARTSELLKLIEQPGADLKSTGFRSDARALAKDAEAVARNPVAGA
jgi:chromosome segregation ATPase